MRNYSSEGIVLARKNYSEADRILTVFSKDFGKIFLLAKGIRKLESRKRGSLEVFNQVKFSVQNTKFLGLITESEIVNSFKIKKDLRRSSVAYYFAEVIDKTTKEDEKNEALYNLTIDYFRKLERSKNLKRLREEFVQEVLVLLGFWPKGRLMVDPDRILEEIIEQGVNSQRVGKIVLG